MQGRRVWEGFPSRGASQASHTIYTYTRETYVHSIILPTHTYTSFSLPMLLSHLHQDLQPSRQPPSAPQSAQGHARAAPKQYPRPHQFLLPAPPTHRRSFRIPHHPRRPHRLHRAPHFTHSRTFSQRSSRSFRPRAGARRIRPSNPEQWPL